jgi:hypothetical protein
MQADGFDCHLGLVRSANELLESEGMVPDVRVAPYDGCPDYETEYDGAIIGWGAYTLIRGRDRRIRFLRELREKLKAGSPILVSCFITPRHLWLLRVTAGIGNALAPLLGRDRVEVGDSLIPNYAHYFTREELEGEMKEGGFELTFCDTRDYGHGVGVAV